MERSHALSHITHIFLSAVFLTLLLLALPTHLRADEAKEFSIGIVPQQSATKLAHLWTPVAKYLSKRTGFRYVFKTAKDIPTFEKRLAEGEYDFAYMNPYHYTVFSVAPGYRAFARETDKHIQGIIVVQKESPFRSIDDLAGQTLAFPAPAAFAASVLPRAYLKQNKIEITPQYVSSHDSVYLAVSRGLYPAGGGIQRTYDVMPESVRQQLRILWKTPGYTPHAFAAHPRLAADVVSTTAETLMALHTEEAGRRLLKALRFNPIGPARDADWDDVRKLEIGLL
jgi:phosphonate transport system substrate-binding protein